MDIQKLKALRATAEAGSISRAAERLGYSQPGLAGMLNRLEQEIGYPLLLRGSGGVRLTDEGRALMPYIERILRESDAFEQAARALRPAQQDELRIGSYTSISKNWLPQVIRGFSKKYPGVRLTVKDGGPEEIEAWLEDGTIDVGLLSDSYSSRIDFIPLLRDPYYAVLPPSITAGETVPISSFTGRTFFIPSNGVDKDVLHLLEENGVRPCISTIATQDSAVIKMVEQGLGCSILGGLVLRGNTDHVSLAPLDPPAWRQLGVGVKSLKALGRATRNFLSFIQNDVQYPSD